MDNGGAGWYTLFRLNERDLIIWNRPSRSFQDPAFPVHHFIASLKTRIGRGRCHSAHWSWTLDGCYFLVLEGAWSRLAGFTGIWRQAACYRRSIYPADCWVCSRVWRSSDDKVWNNWIQVCLPSGRPCPPSLGRHLALIFCLCMYEHSPRSLLSHSTYFNPKLFNRSQ